MNVLILAPHPDDEVLGCGGAIIKHVKAKDKVSVFYLTAGEQGMPGVEMGEASNIRLAESHKVTEFFGITHAGCMHLPDGNLIATSELAGQIYDQICLPDKIDLLYAPHKNESHPDHRSAATLGRLIRTTAKHSREQPLDLYYYEVWTPLQEYNHVVPIEPPDMWRKMQAANLYVSQMKRVKFHLAAQGLARYRGELNHQRYAEVFASQ